MAMTNSRRVQPHRADNKLFATPKVSTTPLNYYYYRVTATPTIGNSLLPTILGTATPTIGNSLLPTILGTNNDTATTILCLNES
jgi:hypothetical protein